MREKGIGLVGRRWDRKGSELLYPTPPSSSYPPYPPSTHTTRPPKRKGIRTLSTVSSCKYYSVFNGEECGWGIGGSVSGRW